MSSSGIDVFRHETLELGGVGVEVIELEGVERVEGVRGSRESRGLRVRGSHAVTDLDAAVDSLDTLDSPSTPRPLLSKGSS
jgi:hypothetical protein